jgi:hypothetical protein
MYSSTITKHWNDQHHTYSCGLKEIKYITENTIHDRISNKLIFDKIAVDTIEKINDQYSQITIWQDVEQESSNYSSTLSFVSVWKWLPKFNRESQIQVLQCQNIYLPHSFVQEIWVATFVAGRQIQDQTGSFLCSSFEKQANAFSLVRYTK